MNRKYIIIAIIAFLIVIIVAIYLIFFHSKETQTNENENQKTTVQLPNSIPQDNAIRVEDRNNQTQVKDSYDKYTNQNVDDFPFYKENGISIAYPMDDQNGKMVDLDYFLESVGAIINPEARNLIGAKFYGLFYCPNGKGAKDFGVTFELENNDPQKIQNVNSEATKAMLKWEPYMLKDLHNILFPGKNFSEEQINQPLVFKEGVSRYTEINLPGGDKRSINYVVDIYPPDHPSSTNYIYIATSKECLQKSLESLFDF